MSMIHIASHKTNSKLTNIQEKDISPNAVDLRLGKVFTIDPEKMFIIDEYQKVHRGTSELKVMSDGYYWLDIGSYEVSMENLITVGEGEAGWVITRSTLNRNGLFLTSGLYDTGYHGAMAGVLHVTVGPAKIKPGTRIGQYLTFQAESLHDYDGDYGAGKAHDEKYI
jgi:deoxycytidine triphosphate deaminase